MYYYRIVDIKNQLGHLWLGYLKMEINLSNIVGICLPISETNYIGNEQEWHKYFWMN